MTEGFGTDDHPYKCFPAIPSPEVEELRRVWAAQQEIWDRRERRGRIIGLCSIVPAVAGGLLIAEGLYRAADLTTQAILMGGFLLILPLSVMQSYFWQRSKRQADDELESIDKPAEPDGGR